MRDPFEELENFTTPGLPMEPLPAAEVRRRGTRMRRRNTALATVGVVAAVAVIATPLAMAATGTNTGERGPGPANTPTATPVTWVTTIPGDFPLTSGLPRTNEHDGSPVEPRAGFEQQVPEICEGAGWTPDDAADVRQATYTGLTEDSLDRGLALYPTEQAAQTALEEVAANVTACSEQTDGKKRWVEVLPSQIGDQSLLFVNHYTDGGDVQVVQLVRVGNAVMEDATPGLGGGDPAIVQQLADGLRERSSEAVDRMCAFSADPC